jgi:hypothetical protein
VLKLVEKLVENDVLLVVDLLVLNVVVVLLLVERDVERLVVFDVLNVVVVLFDVA